MTEIQSDEARPVPLYERHGISQEDCLFFIEQSHDDRRKVTSAADKIRRACDIVELLKDADENFAELSLRTLEQLDRVQSLLKSAEKRSPSMATSKCIGTLKTGSREVRHE